MNNQPQAQTGLRQYFNIRGARVTLLIMIIMTVVNMVLYLTAEEDPFAYAREPVDPQDGNANTSNE